MKKYTLSTVSSAGDLTSSTASSELTLITGDEAPTSANNIVSQVLSFFVTSASTNATPATMTAFLLDEATNTRIASVDFTVAVTAYRTPIAGGASGGYICTVTGPDGTNKLDLNGVQQYISTRTGSPDQSGKTSWYISATVNASLGDLTVYVADTRAI